MFSEVAGVVGDMDGSSSDICIDCGDRKTIEGWMVWIGALSGVCVVVEGMLLSRGIRRARRVVDGSGIQGLERCSSTNSNKYM